MKWNELVDLKEQPQTYRLNEEGQKLLQSYHKFVDYLKIWVKNESVVNLISIISSEEKGTERFELAKRLDVMTNGGKVDIDGTHYTFNKDDPINQFIE
jgi:SPP1 family predicted phage head-tail adaptor